MAEKPGNTGMFKRECNVFKIFMYSPEHLLYFCSVYIC